MLPFQLLIAVFGGWLHREQADVIAFLREENRILKARLVGQRCVSRTVSGDASRNWDSRLVAECSRRFWRPATPRTLRCRSLRRGSQPRLLRLSTTISTCSVL